jgi:hypothetical protein
VVTLLDIGRFLPIDTGYVLIGLFMIGVAVPAFVYSLKEVRAARNRDAENTISSGPDALSPTQLQPWQPDS